MKRDDVEELGSPHVASFANSSRCRARTFFVDVATRRWCSLENAEMLLALARHIFHHGTDGRFYSAVRKYHHEDGKVYWSMDPTADSTTLVNRCEEAQTYEARLRAGMLPSTR